MTNTMYYGEIVAQIALALSHDPDQLQQITSVVEQEQVAYENLSMFCAEVARHFDQLQNQCPEPYHDQRIALDNFIDRLEDYLLHGFPPTYTDIHEMVVKSLKASAYS